MPDGAPPDGLVEALPEADPDADPEGLVERFCWFIEPELLPVEPEEAELPPVAP